ncbi:MAG: glycosyltransferase family 4 protein [Oscillospiraceae bacterium]|nr:glycosyltransferase family 4 protein [Oscillospiraceae bacterium]
MKIAVNIQPLLHSGKSGIGFYQQEILKELLKKNSDSSFTLQYFDPSGRRGEETEKLSGENISLDRCKLLSAGLYQLIWAFLPLPYSLFFKGEPDVSLFFNYYLPPFVRGKRVLVVYDTVIKDMPQTMSAKTRIMLTLTLKRSIKRADKIITISRFSKERIIKHYGVSSDDIAVIPCAVDRERFYPETDREKCLRTAEKYGVRGEYFLYLGNLEPRKNIPRLIKAYSIDVKKKPDIPLLVIAGGKGWQYDDIFRQVQQLGLEERVIFTGYVSDEDAAGLMNGANAFCFPSLYEGFGMPPLEAMACGVPVMVSKEGALAEVAGKCGAAVDPYDEEDIARGLLKLTDKDFLAEQRELGIKRAGEFSWEKSAEMLYSLIKEIT